MTIRSSLFELTPLYHARSECTFTLEKVMPDKREMCLMYNVQRHNPHLACSTWGDRVIQPFRALNLIIAHAHLTTVFIKSSHDL